MTTLGLSHSDLEQLVGILSNQAATALNLTPEQYFIDLVQGAELPSGLEHQAAGGWTGDPERDARRLVKWAESKGVNQANPKFTVLGSLLQVLLPDIGLDEARWIAALISSYSLYRDNALLEDLQTKYPYIRETPAPGLRVSKRCDRKPQVSEFERAFHKAIQEKSKYPQFYLLYGNDGEQHESLVDRLTDEIIIPYVEQTTGLDRGEVLAETVAWPASGNLGDRKRDLELSLIKKFHDNYPGQDYSANTLIRLPRPRDYPIVIINHHIYSSEWDNRTEKVLIEWYIKEYWAQCERDEKNPDFLIFLHTRFLKMEKPRFTVWPFPLSHSKEKQIKRQLHETLNGLEKVCPCLLFEELSSVSEIDVRKWCDEYGFYKNASIRNQKIQNIFTYEKRTLPYRSMAEIEIQLENICREVRS